MILLSLLVVVLDSLKLVSKVRERLLDKGGTILADKLHHAIILLVILVHGDSQIGFANFDVHLLCISKFAYFMELKKSDYRSPSNKIRFFKPCVSNVSPCLRNKSFASRSDKCLHHKQKVRCNQSNLARRRRQVRKQTSQQLGTRRSTSPGART